MNRKDVERAHKEAFGFAHTSKYAIDFAGRIEKFVRREALQAAAALADVAASKWMDNKEVRGPLVGVACDLRRMADEVEPVLKPPENPTVEDYGRSFSIPNPLDQPMSFGDFMQVLRALHQSPRLINEVERIAWEKAGE